MVPGLIRQRIGSRDTQSPALPAAERAPWGPSRRPGSPAMNSRRRIVIPPAASSAVYPGRGYIGTGHCRECRRGSLLRCKSQNLARSRDGQPWRPVSGVLLPRQPVGGARLNGAPSPALARSWGDLCSVNHRGFVALIDLASCDHRIEHSEPLFRQHEPPACVPARSEPLTTNTVAQVTPAHSHSVPLANAKKRDALS
jgi:hypothetical protein